MAADGWTDQLLDQMRTNGDPLGDAAIAETYELGQQEQVRQTLLGFGRNGDAVPAGLSPKLQQYFEESAVLPSWADRAQMERGHELLGRYQPLITAILLCGSLPLCYTCGNGAEVLVRSQRLTSGVYRRLAETSQFVVDVLDNDGLGPSGRGLRSAQKIRLLHATMRYHVSQLGDWDAARLGVPVNQEDLAGTLMSFSVVIPSGLAKLGVELLPEDRDAYFHIWRVIGHVLGVHEQLNAATFDDGSALWDIVLTRQQRPSEAGTVLTKGVLDFIREVLPVPPGVGPTLIRRLTGDKSADVVKVPPADSLTQLGLGAAALPGFGYGKAGDTLPPAAKVASQLGLLIFKEGLLLTNKGRRREWQVPTGLTDSPS
ncbi:MULTISPECIES: oxygenase MpaB family protein [unclassified Streptomyces]|uniref:oxygenase MpaB family protein n=1 Tax=unclassified Streptomyces TaxID=2593676 RepID=UPI00344BD0F3